jgi:hypothetical protein
MHQSIIPGQFFAAVSIVLPLFQYFAITNFFSVCSISFFGSLLQTGRVSVLWPTLAAQSGSFSLDATSVAQNSVTEWYIMQR